MDRSHIQIALLSGGAALIGALLIGGVRGRTTEPIIVSDLLPKPDPEAEEIADELKKTFKLGGGAVPYEPTTPSLQRPSLYGKAAEKERAKEAKKGKGQGKDKSRDKARDKKKSSSGPKAVKASTKPIQVSKPGGGKKAQAKKAQAQKQKRQKAQRQQRASKQKRGKAKKQRRSKKSRSRRGGRRRR